MRDVLFPVLIALVGLAIGIPSYITRSRCWPGMIAGFDRDKCSDVEGLTRWVGGVGVILGGAYLLAAAIAYLAPRFLVTVSIVLAIVSVIGAGVTTSRCARFTRR